MGQDVKVDDITEELSRHHAGGNHDKLGEALRWYAHERFGFDEKTKTPKYHQILSQMHYRFNEGWVYTSTELKKLLIKAWSDDVDWANDEALTEFRESVWMHLTTVYGDFPGIEKPK
jgi:hypothetical protein